MAESVTIGGGFSSHGVCKSPPFHVPNGNGGAYKTEFVLYRSAERTEKIIWWYEGDPRREPHNHPWTYFRSTILSGGYTEDRYWFDESNVFQKETITYRSDGLSINNMPNGVFHVVYDVQPETVTYLECGEEMPDKKWGYLDIDTRQYRDAEKDLQFIADLHALNPHLRRK